MSSISSGDSRADTLLEEMKEKVMQSVFETIVTCGMSSNPADVRAFVKGSCEELFVRVGLFVRDELKKKRDEDDEEAACYEFVFRVCYQDKTWEDLTFCVPVRKVEMRTGIPTPDGRCRVPTTEAARYDMVADIAISVLRARLYKYLTGDTNKDVDKWFCTCAKLIRGEPM